MSKFISLYDWLLLSKHERKQYLKEYESQCIDIGVENILKLKYLLGLN